MLINWFEIVAQLFNFVVLVWLLKKFFYKPILQAMEDRQQKINEIQNEAYDKMEQANALIKTYVEKKAEWERKKDQMLLAAKQDLEAMKQEERAKIQEESSQKRQAYLKEVQEEKDAFLLSLRVHLGKESVALAREILKRTVGDDLHQRLFEDFLQEIARWEPPQESISLGQGHKVVISSARPFAAEEKKRLEPLLQEKLEHVVKTEYRVAKDMVAGYALQLETVTLGYYLQKHLEDVEKKMLSLLEGYETQAWSKVKAR